MKRELLKEFGLDEDAINKIMAENGKDIEKAKADGEKLSAELEQTKGELAKANETLEKFKDYDVVKSDVEKYKAEAEKSKAEYENKLAKMELSAKVKDFTGSKKFVNDLTRNAINKALEEALEDEANKGTSLEDLLAKVTEGQTNIFVEENKVTPPVTPNMSETKPTEESGLISAFKRLNPNLKID